MEQWPANRVQMRLIGGKDFEKLGFPKEKPTDVIIYPKNDIVRKTENLNCKRTVCFKNNI